MKNEVKTSIDGLDVGMYISRLDRPWIKTPFALEGIKITSRDEITRVRKYCNYVYVDVEQGASPDARYWILTGVPSTANQGRAQSRVRTSRSGEKQEYRALRKTTYRESETFKSEIKTASKASHKLTKGYKKLLRDLETGRNLDLNTVETGISYMVESVLRNPSAMMWIVQLEKLDEYTYSRALGTSVWCATFGRHLGLEKDAIRQLAMGGLLLDLGKSRLPVELLKKKGKLTEDELKIMYQHVDLGVKLLASEKDTLKMKKLDMVVLQMVATHHERADGSGYPQGLNIQNIPMFGRIAGIVDSYDAMTSVRPFLNAGPRTPHEVIAELYDLRGSKFQAELVEQFIQTVGLYPTGSLVELNTGEVGAVVAINGLHRLKPTVMLLLDEHKEPYTEFRHLNLSTVEGDVRVEKGLSPNAYGINMTELFL